MSHGTAFMIKWAQYPANSPHFAVRTGYVSSLFLLKIIILRFDFNGVRPRKGRRFCL